MATPSTTATTPTAPAPSPPITASAPASTTGGGGAGMSATTGAPASIPVARPGGRRKYMYGGREIYEWEQDLSEVHVYFKPPPGVRASMIECKIGTGHVTLGIKGNRPFLDEDLSSSVVVKDSLWMMEDGTITLSLQKMRKGETWPAAFKGHGELDPVAASEVQRRMLLERFQEEHPGFDFSGAEVNGTVPDPRTFMGGVKYT